ncbi:MAG: glutamyl-tRNA reductase [Candidatus Eiseniibacteriota bacterium]
MPHILVVGLSHHTAPLDVREKLALTPEETPDALARVRARPGVREAALVSTCNRSELYAVTDTYHGGREELEKGIAEIALPHGGVSDEYLYRLEGAAVVRHLFRVAGSLDALVVGEPQILGQVKDAFRMAQESSAVGPIVDRMFRQALEVGKRVRAETEIGAYAVSVSYAAVELAKKIFGSLTGRAALIIGAGETGELTMRHLRNAGVSDLLVANRTIGTAEALAGELGARPLRLGDLEEALRQVDIVISSTGAAAPILDRRTVERTMKERRGRPLFLIDIAVPRDIDPACGSVYNVFLYNIDDLGRVVAGNRERRLEEAERALDIVNQEVGRFMRWFEGLETVPTIVALRERLEAVRDEETEKILKRLEHLSERDRKLVEQFGETLLHRMLHGPTAQLRHVGSGERGLELASALRYLFRLEEGQGGEPGSEDRKDERGG